MRNAFVLTILMLLTGCAGTTETIQRYQLATLVIPDDQNVSNKQPLLVVAAPEINDLLNQPGIVMQTDDITLHAARQHVWASNLDQQIRTGLQKRLQQHLKDYQVVLQTTDRQAAARIMLRVDAFQGHHNGSALTTGQWQLIDSDGTLSINQQLLIETPLATDGYPALVRALSSNLDKLAAQMGAEIDNLR